VSGSASGTGIWAASTGRFYGTALTGLRRDRVIA